MRNIIKCIVVLSILFTSCMREDRDTPKIVLASFSISTPELKSGNDSIKYGDGLLVNDLFYAIWEADDSLYPKDATNFVKGVKNDAFAGHNTTTNVEIELVQGKKYMILFWAQASDAPYTIDWETYSVKMTDEAFVSNNEKLDAFYGRTSFELRSEQYTENIVLKHPFAQMNICCDPSMDAKLTSVKMEVATSIDLISGLVGSFKEVNYSVEDNSSVCTVTFKSVNSDRDIVYFNYLLEDCPWNDDYYSEDLGTFRDVMTSYINEKGDCDSHELSGLPFEVNMRLFLISYYASGGDIGHQPVIFPYDYWN